MYPPSLLLLVWMTIRIRCPKQKGRPKDGRKNYCEYLNKVLIGKNLWIIFRTNRKRLVFNYCYFISLVSSVGLVVIHYWLQFHMQLQESVGPESRELSRYLSKREEQERQEEELFIRAPTTKRDKKLEKHLMKSRNGYVASYSFY